MPAQRGAAIGLGLGLLAGTGILIYFATRAEAKEIELIIGWNEVIYTGKRQTVERAVASIIDHLVIVYYLNEQMLWQQMITGDLMVPGRVYYIEVSENCIWTF